MRIGELLLAAGLVSEADIARAVDRQHEEGGRLGPNLVAVGAISEEALAKFCDGVPIEPGTIQETGLPETFLVDLMLKLIFVGPAESVADLAAALRLSPGVVTDLLEAAVRGQMVVALGSNGGALAMRYELTETGKTRAREAMARSAYTGPAPVPLEVYAHWIERQKVTNEIVNVERLRNAFDDLEVADALVDKLGPAVTSGRTLLMYGPPGNGKTSVAQRLDRVFRHVIYIPHAVLVEGQVMTVYDPDLHRPVAGGAASRPRLTTSLWRDEADGRFVPCRRPFIVAGGELTMEMLDLKHEAGGNFYVAPLHMKAAGGCFLIDDFGRQMVSPTALLNRWIVPLENKVDYLKLATGKSFRVPFQTVVIFSTNLSPADLMDGAFLRRIPYKLEIGAPSAEAWRRIFKSVCAANHVPAEDSQVREIERLISDRHGLDLAAYQPRFLIEQILASANFRGTPPSLSPELVNLALDNLTIGRAGPSEAATLARVA
ncbi:ATP-binding protein [Sandarakinorhabdus rubra]|uniref:ATP-binding protein n=1 Tax=Sandarakinorhabdus rubra TaxID=2672568 RepID=UPI0013DA99B8|nr:ATP-binding protein [Sandarakinorhabdus rubra]